MRSIYAHRILTLLAACLLLALALPAYGQGRTRGRSYSKGDVERIIRRAEDKSDDFRKLIDRELDRSILDKTKLEDNIQVA